jgi:3-oxoacyl-[acyl-carrier-protein] synthase II
VFVQREPVVVTGMGVICAAGRDVAEFWDNVTAGRSFVGPATCAELAGFDPAFVGEVPDAWLEDRFEPGERERLDRASLLAIEAARQALDGAGLAAGTLPPGRTGLVLGKCQGQSNRPGGGLAQIHATCDDLAAWLDTSGPRLVVSTACAAGGNAVGIARDKLWRGEVDVALAGGVDVLLAATFLGFGALQALAGAPCAPYSRSDGLSLGEGAAFLVVERRRDAEARGAPILAEVRGYGLSADAYHPTAPDPTGRGAVTAVRRALDDAGADVADVSYVNGHGTGTPANDRMERKAMRLLFGARTAAVPVSGTKSFVGHTLGASGAIEAVACVLAIRHGIVPPTANFDDAAAPEDEFDFVPHRGREADVDLTVSNNYAFGGNNACLVLSRPRAEAAAPRPERARRLVVTGWGPVGPLGVGIEAWRAALAEGRSALAPVPGLAGVRAALMDPLRIRPVVDPKQWRQLSELARQCAAATKLACDDAALVLDRAGREALGVVFATGFGPMADAMSFEGGMATEPKVSAFANITMNAPAGAVCRALGLRGPTTTITHGATSFFHGLACAADLIAQDRTGAVVVLAADELSPEIVRLRHALGGELGASLPPTGLGHAVVACVVEDHDAALARGAPVYAEVSSCVASGDPGPPSADGYAAVLGRALDGAAVSAADVGYVAASAAGHAGDAVEARALGQCLKPDTPVSDPRVLTGDCEAASGAINVCCASLATSLPGTLAPAGHALAAVVDGSGNYAAAVLAAVEGGRR